MKPKRTIHDPKLLAFLLGAIALVVVAGLLRKETKHVTIQDSGSSAAPSTHEETKEDRSTRTHPMRSTLPDNYLQAGEIVSSEKLDDCYFLVRGETSLLCYDTVTRCVFRTRYQKLIRKVAAFPSSQDVLVEERDAFGNTTMSTLSPAYSSATYVDVLETYIGADGKRSDVPVPMDRPQIFDSKEAVKPKKLSP